MAIKHEKITDQLERIGLSDKEAKVYTSLLELGGAFPSRVATYSNINRTTVYAVLLNLSVRGLVNEIEKRGKLFYTAERPSKLLRFAENQARVAEERIEQTKEILPEIESLFAAYRNMPGVSYFDGTDGIRRIYEDMLAYEKKYEMVAFSNAAEIKHAFPEKFFGPFRRTKERKGITTRGILPDTPENRLFNEKHFSGYKTHIVPKVKYVDSQKFPFKGEITIYGEDRVGIINLNHEFFSGIIIKDKDIHGILRLAFNLAWSSSEVVE